MSFQPAVQEKRSKPEANFAATFSAPSVEAQSTIDLDGVDAHVVDDDPFLDRDEHDGVSVRSIALHPNGLYVLMGCRHGVRIFSRLYTVLADDLKLVYEVDSRPQALVLEVSHLSGHRHPRCCSLTDFARAVFVSKG